MVEAYRTDDPWQGVARGVALGNALRDDYARTRAGASLSRGDYQGASNALLMSGDLAGGLKVQDYAARQAAGEAEAVQVKRNAVLKFTEEAADRLSEIHRTTKDPAKTVAAFDQYFAPRFRELGEDDAEIGQLRNGLLQDPDTTLMALGAGAAKELGYELRSAGDEVLVFQGGKLINRYRGAKTATLGPESELVEIPGAYGDGSAPAGDAPARSEPEAAQNTAPPDVEAVWQAAKMQESGGRGDALSSAGAEGSTQMLPATAEAMARKLGIRWDPRLMRETTPQALAYQDKLGRAYFEEGLEKYGNVEDALRYYHGGPDQAQWGPKTEAHVKAVMGRVQPYEVAAAGDTPPPPSDGVRVLARGRAKPRGHMATAQEKAALGLSSDAPYWIDAEGRPSAVSGEKPNKPLTEYQGKSVEYLNAALSGNDRMNDLAKVGIYKPSTPTDSLFAREKDGSIRFIGRSETDRRYIQAAKEWLAPILRKDTGAAVTDGEVSQYMDIYIPRFEDPESVMWQKAQARDAKMRALYGANRAAYDQTFGAPPQWQVLTAPGGKPGGSGYPPEAVALLKRENTPERRRQFDQVFGAGAAAKVLGSR